MILSALYLYPIKSLGGIAVSEAVVEARGFRYDRRFMLVEPDGTFITQRSVHEMALIDVAFAGPADQPTQLHVWHRHRPDNVLEIPLEPVSDTWLPVSVWDSTNVAALVVSAEADRWFSTTLGQPCRLVYMPPTTYRPVEPNYAQPDAQGKLPAVSFADGYPYLLIGQASLDELNQRLTDPITMQRFRPSIVVSGSLPFEEDTWHQFRIGSVDFYGVKPCARCVLTTIDPATGERGSEPLRTLATYRRWKNKILFGQNVVPGELPEATRLQTGQSISVLERVAPWLPAPENPTV